MQVWAYLNYRDSDIAAIAIVIYYRDISHYRYYRSALLISNLVKSLTRYYPSPRFEHCPGSWNTEIKEMGDDTHGNTK